jgi:plasmid stability protein
MSTNIQIRNVPDELRRTLKARSALAGMSHWEHLMERQRNQGMDCEAPGAQRAAQAPDSRKGCGS